LIFSPICSAMNRLRKGLLARESKE